MKNKYCFVIVGPTAAGKTYFAIQLAKYFNTQIISADSRQCYKELNIGVAKPLPNELEQIKHYFINSHSIQQEVNAKVFEAYAIDAASNIFRENDFVVLAGGTGLYVNAFCNGIDEIPVINAGIKHNITSTFKKEGIEWLQNQVEKEDPVYFKRGEIKNPQRLIRALEVKLSTGKSITEYHKQYKKKNTFNIIKVGLELPKEQLKQNINSRVDRMIQEGLVDEAQSLIGYRRLNALNTVGYRELFAHFDGENSLEQSVDQIKLNTRHYAKRQMTWFKKDAEIKWVNAMMESSSFINVCNELMSGR